MQARDARAGSPLVLPAEEGRLGATDELLCAHATYREPMSTPAAQTKQRLAAWLRARPLLVDVGIAVSLSAVSIMALFVNDTLPDARPADALGVLLLLCSCLPLAARRRAPVPVLLAVAGPTTVLLALDYAGSIGVGLIIAVYTVAAYRGRALAWLALVVGLAGFLVSLPFVDQKVGVADIVAVAGVVFASSAFGRSIGFRRAYTAELELRAHRLEQARESDVRAVIAEERGRIARELHDVVAHHVSVMTVQASAAQRTLARNPDAAREAMAAVESTGRAALVEMRRMVGVLRADDEREALCPQPGLAELPSLVEQVRDAGLGVDLGVEGTVRALEAGVDLVAYRIVQEALTNCLKHAGPAHARVAVRYAPAAVHISVHDDGRGAAPGSLDSNSDGATRTGHGLHGMRERVALYGGTLSVGPARGGGFTVSAVLPSAAAPADVCATTATTAAPGAPAAAPVQADPPTPGVAPVLPGGPAASVRRVDA